MALTLLLLALTAVPAGKDEAIDPRTVQSATIYELNVDAVTCHSIVEGNAICAGAGRHYELKQSERDRVLALLSSRGSFDAKTRPTCAVPREAIVVETTTGRRAFDISLECNNVGGRAPTKAA